jgi:hypothetical protein
MSALRSSLLRWRWQAAGLGLVAAFAVLAGRFWHPHYGFTRFVQLDAADRQTAIRELREYPVFYYEGFNGYDGAAYTQIAFHPLLAAPELQTAIDNLPYRARRILGSALAWLLAGGDPARIAHTYAALNLGVWLLLAAVLWRVLPVTDARSLAAWAGVLFSAGALHAVRLALTDLLATALVTMALWLGEKGRPRTALGALAAAGLARETALAALVALWQGPWRSARAWTGNLVRTGLVALPLLAWMLYVRWRIGAGNQGLGNLTWPVVGWVEKWGETVTDYARHPEFGWLITTTLLATIGLTVQAAFLLRRPRWKNGWWRAGLTGVALMVMLGTAVWEGHPGAATRVLLPMTVSFAVVAVRAGASWRWIAAGSLPVFSGVLALWHVPPAALELDAGRIAGGSYVAKIGDGWYGLEEGRGATWAWSAGPATLVVETSPRATTPLRLRLNVRAFTPRTLEVREGDTILFRGPVTTSYTWIDLPALVPRQQGQLHLELRSPEPPVPENTQPGSRGLAFALRAIEGR